MSLRSMDVAVIAEIELYEQRGDEEVQQEQVMGDILDDNDLGQGEYKTSPRSPYFAS